MTAPTDSISFVMHFLSSRLGAQEFGLDPMGTRILSWAIPRSNLWALGGIRFSYLCLLCSVLQALWVHPLLYESDDRNFYNVQCFFPFPVSVQLLVLLLFFVHTFFFFTTLFIFLFFLVRRFGCVELLLSYRYSSRDQGDGKEKKDVSLFPHGDGTRVCSSPNRIRERKRCWPAQILQRFKQIYQFMPSLVIRPTVALESNENVSLYRLL